MKHLRSLLSVAAAAAAFLGAAAPAQAAAPSIALPGTYLIRDVQTGLCLTPVDPTGLTSTVLGSCTNPWTLTNLPNGSTLISSATGALRCLSSSLLGGLGGGLSGLPAGLTACTGGLGQSWRIVGDPATGPVNIASSLLPGLCLAAPEPIRSVLVLPCGLPNWVLQRVA